MAHTVHFSGRHRWATSSNNRSNRPYSAFTLHGTGGQHINIWGLLDTGADYVMLDTAFAAAIGVAPLASVRTTKVHFANGTVQILPLIPVALTIEGKRIQTDVIFAPGVPALIGRIAILDAMEFGMDDHGWLFHPHP